MKTIDNLRNKLELIRKNNSNLNIFLYVRNEDDLIKEAEEIDKKIKLNKAGKLAGKIIGIKANICVKNLPISCASKTLKDYIAPYDATVIKKIKEEDGLIIGILNMDEFACGGSGETSAFGPTKNPISTDRIPGGSSSGSAAAIAAKFCDLTLGSDTGGSVRNPASHCGVIGLKPTYSSISRYGLIDLSMSLDQIGVLGEDLSEVRLLFDIIKGKDPLDAISQDSMKLKISKKPVIGLLDFEVNDERIQNLINENVKKIAEKNNLEIKNVKIKNIDLGVATYYMIVYVEFFSGTRKFDGRRFGEVIEDTCGKEVLRRILGGKEISKAEYEGRYYDLALKAKKLIEKEFSDLFKEVDCIICPTVPKLPHKINDNISVEEMYSYDVLTVLPSLAGNCAISIPSGKIDGLPVGMQVICDKFNEDKLFEISKLFVK